MTTWGEVLWAIARFLFATPYYFRRWRYRRKFHPDGSLKKRTKTTLDAHWAKQSYWRQQIIARNGIEGLQIEYEMHRASYFVSFRYHGRRYGFLLGAHKTDMLAWDQGTMALWALVEQEIKRILHQIEEGA